MTATIVVEGTRLEGFEEGTLQLTMTEAVNTFEVSYVPPTLLDRLVFEQDRVEVRIGDEVLLEGHVDETDEEDDTERVRVRVLGRSAAQDVVDCSAIQAPGSWTNATIGTIVADLAAPFSVGTFVDDREGKRFATFSVTKGDTAYDTIARAAVKRGLIVYSVGGDLVLARAGSYRTATVLERGANVIRSGRRSSMLNRYSQYVFAGQARPNEDTWGSRSQQLKHIVVDEHVRRFRPLRVNAESHSGLDLEGRALLERNQRAGKSETVSCTVRGHLTDEGAAWRPNTLVHFRNPVLGIDATLIIVTARFHFGAAEDDSTELELARPEAYDIAKYPALGRGETWT